MKHAYILLILATFASCQKSFSPEPEPVSEGRGGNIHVKAMLTKTQFASPVRFYAYEDGQITRSGYMDNAYAVSYDRKKGKITLTSEYFGTEDMKTYTFGKNGRLTGMDYVVTGIVISHETYGYRGCLLNEINTGPYVRRSDILSPWLQRIVTTYGSPGSVTGRDTLFIRQTGAWELTSFGSDMKKKYVYSFSPCIKDPEYNIPYTPSFDKIRSMVAEENLNRGWGMYNKPMFMGKLLIRTVRYDNGDPYPENWLENIVTNEDNMPVSYAEWFTERFRDGWQYSKAIPTTYTYTTVY
jgi:hypothetical protein